MAELISIIVPVYNVEQYLDRCIKSVVAQTYSNLQIILVDDGATDKSGEICDLWGKKALLTPNIMMTVLIIAKRTA